jgi:signal transduction histidine kinase
MTSPHINDVPASIVVTTLDLLVMDCNRQWRREFGRDDPSGHRETLYDFATPATRIFLQTHILPTLLRDGEISEIHVSLLESGGEERPVLLNALADGSGARRRIIWLLFSARRRRKLEAELQRRKRAAEAMAAHLDRTSRDLKRSNEALASFAGMVTHDLKAPVRQVQGFAELLENELRGTLSDEAGQMLGFLKGAAGNLVRIIDDLHRYSLVGTNHGEFGTVEVASFLEGVFRSLASDTPFRFAYEGSVEQLDTLTVPFELVVRNLIHNAIKHHDRDDGAISASVVEDGDHYRIDIADDGPGVASDHHDAIFGEHTRLSARKGGSGLGLAMVKRTVESYGGRVSVQSSLGEGARFSVWWPRETELKELLST